MSGLDDLFAADSPTDATDDAGLDDLFAEPAVPAAPAAGLDDLFAEPAAAPAFPAPAPAAAPEPVVAAEPEPAPVEEDDSVDLGQLLGGTITTTTAPWGIVTAPDPDPTDDDTDDGEDEGDVDASASPWPPATPASDTAPSGPQGIGAGVKAPRDLGLAERRRAAEEASMGDTASDALRLAAARDQFERRFADQERLWPAVQRIQGLIAAEPRLTSELRGFTLTRDKALDFAQRTKMETLISPMLMTARVDIQDPGEIRAIFDIVYDEYIGISVLGDPWRDDEVTEICVDGWNKIAVERNGKLEQTPIRFRDEEHANGVARQLSTIVSDRGVSPTNPLVTAQLPQARVQFVWGSLAGSGLAITIRKFRPLLGTDALLKYHSINNEIALFLDDVIAARGNVLVSGGTGTGKTTMINALSEAIPDYERVITIEDAFELTLSNRHIVSMQTKEKASADDTTVLGQEQLLVASLRMRPDRIIVGEIREPSAAATMLEAANTGHDGTMTTIHANSPERAIRRLGGLLVRSGGGFGEAAARAEVAAAFDVIIQISRRNGHRYVSEIALVESDDSADGYTITPLWTATATVADGPVHRRVGVVGADTELGQKMTDVGRDVTRWETP